MTPAQLRNICTQAVQNNAYPTIAPEHILAILNSVEYLSTRLPDNTTDCQSLALDYQAALGRIAALEAQLKTIQRIILAHSDLARINGTLSSNVLLMKLYEAIERVKNDN